MLIGVAVCARALAIGAKGTASKTTALANFIMRSLQQVMFADWRPEPRGQAGWPGRVCASRFLLCRRRSGGCPYSLEPRKLGRRGGALQAQHPQISTG